MAGTPSAALTAWSSFYVMTGSAAAALTGLMFIVITLIGNVERLRRNPDGVSAFSTPTVVHFCAAFLVSAVLCAPWHSLVPAAAFLGLAGGFGVAYVFRVMLRQLHIVAYRPDLEDLVWHTILPFVAYGGILAGALVLLAGRAAAQAVTAAALDCFAASVVLLILIGIHNAWDIVTFITITPPEDPPATS